MYRFMYRTMALVSRYVSYRGKMCHCSANPGNWYLATKGIPTGGVLSPLLANITMTYVLNNVLFNKEDDVNANPRGFQGIMRFIDDLGGRWVGPTEPFHKWVQWLNGCTKPKYGIEFTSRIGNEVEFLDILISFDPLGKMVVLNQSMG